MSDEMMNDEQFLGYFSLHSRTERALFHRDDINRLMRLVGNEELTELPEWVAVRNEIADPLIERARLVTAAPKSWRYDPEQCVDGSRILTRIYGTGWLHGTSPYAQAFIQIGALEDEGSLNVEVNWSWARDRAVAIETGMKALSR